MVHFQTILNQRLVFKTLDINWIEHSLSLSTCDTMHHAWESKNKLELFYWLFISILSYCFLPWLKHMFEGSLKLLLCIAKWFNAFQAQKWFLCLHRAACTIFAHKINAEVWQAIIVHTTQSPKNCSMGQLKLQRIQIFPIFEFCKFQILAVVESDQHVIEF